MTTTSAPPRPSRRALRQGQSGRASGAARRAQEDAVAEARARRREQERRERGLAGARRARSLPGLVDLGVVALIVVLAAVGLGPVWGGAGPVLAVGGGLVLGLGLAWLAAVRRWGILTVTAVTMATYVALGGAFALPHTTVAGVVPTLATLRGLLLGTVTVWKDWLTAAPPLAAYADLAVAPFLATLVVTVIAAGVALRSRRGFGALVPLAVLFVAIIAGSSTQEAFPLAQGLGAVVLALGWAAWRSRREESEPTADTDPDPGHEAQRAALRTRRVRGTAMLLGGTVLVTALVAPLVAPGGQRVVLRDVIVPPLELHDFTSPLVGFRSYAKDRAEDVLFTVEGLPAGERLRLATLDTYTGTVMDVAGGVAGGDSGSFRRAGSTLPEAPLMRGAVPQPGEPARVTVTVGDYEDVWLPVVGEPNAVDFAGPRAAELRRGLHLNPNGPTALTTAGLVAGDRYTVTATVRPKPTGSQLDAAHLADLDLPAPQSVPDAVAATADRFVGDAGGDLATVQSLRDGLASSGVLSSGRDGQPPSRAGHGADRIATLLAEADLVGDDEQFAVAMALMARQLDIPARVVMGFYNADAPTDVAPTGPVEVRGADVHAWVEVAFAGIGWVAFDPRPDDDTPPQSSEARSQAQPQPQQLLEPQPPEEPEEPPTQPLPEDAEEDELETETESWTRWLVLAGVAVGGLLILALPFVVIAAVKARRRARRRRAAAAVERVIGGWAEVVDLGRDLGHEPPGGATRRETGRGLAEHYPAAGVVTLARHTDAGVFGPGDPALEDVEALWGEVESVLGAMSGSVGWWTRTRARFSLRSLRRVRR